MTEAAPTLALTVGIIVAREPTTHPWQEFRWRPAEMLIGPQTFSRGDIVADATERRLYFGGALEIELHRKGTAAYVVNLDNEIPVVYVVLRDAEGQTDADGLAVDVVYVTVSPFEAQDYLDSGEDIVEPIEMPAAMIALLEQFVAEHYEEETFIKRRRDKVDILEEKFGQEPIERIRQMRKDH